MCVDLRRRNDAAGRSLGLRISHHSVFLSTEGVSTTDSPEGELLQPDAEQCRRRFQDPGGQQFHTGRWRQKRSGAISQNAAALNAKMPMPIHTIVMVMAAAAGP